MTFEKAYGKWLVNELNSRTNDLLGIRCKQYNEMAFKPLSNNPDGVAVVLSGGGIARSAVQAQDQNSGTFSVALICQKKYMDGVRAAIEGFQKDNNAVPMEMEFMEGKETLKINVKSVFFTPTISDVQDYPTEEYGTLKVVFMMFAITVLYGETAVVAPSNFKLFVDDKAYDINHIYSYDNASIPTYDTYLAQGENRNRQIPLIKNNSWAITVYQTSATDELQKILQNEIDGIDGGLWGKTLKLQKDNESAVEIRAYQLAASYVENAAAFVLTVML